MDADGTNVKQLTHELGYDGGPFWSYDGKKIVYRAEHPQTPAQINDYKDLYARGLIRPGNLEIWVMNADGSGKHQVTHNGAANFAPYWLPDGKRIVFASNLGNTKDPAGFDLYLINEDGTGLERITTIPASTPSRCSPPMASASCGPPIATAARSTKPTSSSPTGSNNGAFSVALLAVRQGPGVVLTVECGEC